MLNVKKIIKNQVFSSKSLIFLKKQGIIIQQIYKKLEEWEQIPLLTYEREKFKLANIEEKIENLTYNSIKELGYELYDVEYVKEGKDYFLRLYIESDKRNRFK